MKSDGTPKPVLDTINALSNFLSSLPMKALPRAQREAVCIVSHNLDDWAVVFGTFALAKQAKLELDFAHFEHTIPEAPLYLLSSISGSNSISKHQWT